MENQLIKFLSKYIAVSDELKNELINTAQIKYFRKKTVLLREGNLSNECFFIFKGCLRSYHVVNGEEKTTAFYTEGQPVTPLAYGKGKPSEQFFECVEDSILSIGTPNDSETDLSDKFPELKSICHIVTEDLLVKSQEEFIDFMLTTPEERYLNLLKNRPDLAQRVPQYQLASYLGIKPESLSRLRKCIFMKQTA